MFTDYFYFCREKGLDVSLSEWLSLVEAMLGESTIGFKFNLSS